MIAFAMLAEEAGAMARAEDQISGVLKFVLVNPFALALTLIFLIAIIAAFVAARKRDRCLKKFRDCPVTLLRQDGRTLWGRLRVFSKGLELVYARSAQEGGKRSLLIYEPELAGILTVYRFVDRLDAKEHARQARQAALLMRMKLPYRTWRGLQNLVNTFRDAIVQAMGLTMQQASKVASNPVLSVGQAPIATLGATLASGFAYEPMLEQYIGQPVFLDLVNPADAGKPPVEYRGMLGEYSDKYILLVGVSHRFTERVALAGQEASFVEDRVRVRPAEGGLAIQNQSPLVVRVDAVECAGVLREINEAVPPGETAEVALPESICDAGAAAILSYERTFDVIVQRSRGAVRHAGA